MLNNVPITPIYVKGILLKEGSIENGIPVFILTIQRKLAFNLK